MRDTAWLTRLTLGTTAVVVSGETVWFDGPAHKRPVPVGTVVVFVAVGVLRGRACAVAVQPADVTRSWVDPDVSIAEFYEEHVAVVDVPASSWLLRVS